ncbi:hypothetical protein P886_0053 [Alteromonadaceae bacterium 2753L.S.0a.02]|nr:hypothetical protein P886_0053 [Alteromonadaceae bacterium 2753L.S.0a.02]
MQILSSCHLTYCTNIHPGEDWETLYTNLRQHLPEVKRQVCPDQAMGVGLRLSARAAEYLSLNSHALENFQSWLDQQQLYVFTLNGFPYGTFHNDAVKESVYQPDWSSNERLEYSCTLAALLVQLLPSGLHGSISTVPVGFAPHLEAEENLQGAVANILECAAFLIQLRERTGVTVQLALEPEPGCYLENTAGTISFFNKHLFTESALQTVTELVEPGFDLGIDSLRQHLGVCLDTCHAAVMFENSQQAAEALLEAHIPIHKIQLTAALQLAPVTENAIQQLSAFAEGVYLHQTCLQHNDQIDFYLDLPEALEHAAQAQELRSHFHVPVFYQSLQNTGTTQNDLQAILAAQREQLYSPHLEVETYTFDVLPMQLRSDSVVNNITRELQWVLGYLS